MNLISGHDHSPIFGAALTVACAIAGLSPARAADTAGPAIAEWPGCLAGKYDGGQTEVAARLALNADHRFTYELSYGALDEGSEGRWEPDGNDVVLTSDAVNPPRYSLVTDEPLSARELHIALDLPRGISAQYFESLVGFADGSRMIRQLSDDGQMSRKPFVSKLAQGQSDFACPMFRRRHAPSPHLLLVRLGPPPPRLLIVVLGLASRVEPQHRRHVGSIADGVRGQPRAGL